MRRWGAAGLAALLVAGVTTLAVGLEAGRAQTGAYYSITPPSQVVQSDVSEITVDINVHDVQNLGAFEFRIVYDPTVLQYKEVRRGPFIASTGRIATCLTGERTNSTIQWGCSTTGQEGTGASGSGRVATLVFTPAGMGTSPLVFNKVEFAAADGPVTSIPAGTPHEGVIEVVGPNDDTDEPPPPTPTHNPTLLTPTPIPNAPTPDNTYRLTDPQSEDGSDNPTGNVPGNGSGSESQGGSGAGGSGTAGGVQGSRTGGAGNRATGIGRAGSNFPVAGYGATVATMELAARIPLAGRVLLSAGIALVAAGAFARRQQDGGRA